mgnify:CR=1 FL=1
MRGEELRLKKGKNRKKALGVFRLRDRGSLVEDLEGRTGKLVQRESRRGDKNKKGTAKEREKN